jgi:hypothetical protein
MAAANALSEREDLGDAAALLDGQGTMGDQNSLAAELAGSFAGDVSFPRTSREGVVDLAVSRTFTVRAHDVATGTHRHDGPAANLSGPSPTRHSVRRDCNL